MDRRKTNPWHNTHKKLAWWAEREGRADRFWITLSNVIIFVRRLIRKKPGVSIAGREDPHLGHVDLLAEALTAVPVSIDPCVSLWK